MKIFLLWWRLHGCRHKSTSLPFGGRLVTCFYCGSTKEPGEPKWLAPWLWRKP